MTDFNYDIDSELQEIKINAFLKGLSEDGKAALMRKMLGPLLTPGLLSTREAAFFFLEAALDKSQKAIAREFKILPSSVNRTLCSAEKKVKDHRRGRERI